MSQGFPGNDPSFPPIAGSLPNPYGVAGNPPAYAPAVPPTNYGTGGTSGGPYSSPGAPPPKGRSGCVVAAIVISIVGAGLLMCGGCLGLGIFALNGEYTEKARLLSVDYRNHPKVKEQVGEVQEVSYNWSASLNEEGEDAHVYDVRGDKGTAQFLVEEGDEDEITDVKLRNGKGEWPLTPTPAADAPPNIPF